MDEHQKIKKPRAGTGSLDGFVSDGRQLGVTIPQSYQPGVDSTPNLGAYSNKIDGFHPIRQAPREMSHTPEAAEVEALLNDPIVLDDDFNKRKRRLVRKSPRARRRIKRGVVVLLTLVLITAGYFGLKIYQTERHLFRGGGKAPALASNIDINQLKGEGDGRVNVLLLGVGGPGHDGPDLTDTILLMSIDPINHNAALLSIPRDLCIKMPCSANQKINAVYALAKEDSRAKTLAGQEQDGLNALDSALAPVLGIPIHYHVVVDFSAFKQAVDALGGVTFNVPTTLWDPTIAWENNNNPYIAYKGTQTMHGQQALLYARSRETSSDFARGQRQRQLIVALKDKAFSVGTFSNPVKVSSLLDSLGNNVYSDFSLNDITRLQQIFSKIPSSSITSLDLTTPPNNLVTTGTVDGTTSIVEPRAGLFDYSAIQNYIHNAIKDSFIAKENAHIAVYNATDITGLATASANTLKSFGYNVTTVTNTTTTTNPARTTIVDLTRGVDKYTGHYLEERFGVKTVTSLPSNFAIKPPAGTSFVIILGRDAANSTKTSFAN